MPNNVFSTTNASSIHPAARANNLLLHNTGARHAPFNEIYLIQARRASAPAISTSECTMRGGCRAASPARRVRARRADCECILSPLTATGAVTARSRTVHGVHGGHGRPALTAHAEAPAGGGGVVGWG